MPIPAGSYARGRGARGLVPNGCIIVHNINNIVVSVEAILSAENSGKPLGGRGSASNPAGVGYNVPHCWSPWVQRSTMQYQTGVKHFNEIILSASLTTNVVIP